MATSIRHFKGFTLIELLTIVAIVGILASITMPRFIDIVNNNRMATQFNELITSLSYARSEAIKRNMSVTVCKSDDGNACGGDWHNGWLVFVDKNKNGVVNATDELLRKHEALTAGSLLTFARNRVSYSNKGLAIGYTGKFVLCDSRGNEYRKGLVVSNTGRVRQTIPSDSLANCV